MEIIFLGTGTSQGVPVIACTCAVCQSTDTHDKRLRTSALIRTQGKTILIDAGPDFRQQLLRENVTHLDAILLTHEHKDHTGGLDDVRALNYVTGKPVDIYAEERVLRAVRQEFAYAFSEDKYPGVPDMNLIAINDAPFFVGDVKIEPIRVMHHRLPIYAFRIGNFDYVTDANFIAEESKQKLRGAKILIVNALRKEKHISHFTLSEAIQLANELGVDNTYLTHISHQLGLYAETSNILPTHINLAYDGLRLHI